VIPILPLQLTVDLNMALKKHVFDATKINQTGKTHENFHNSIIHLKFPANDEVLIMGELPNSSAPQLQVLLCLLAVL
jgi:hypothetical protein